MWVVKLGGSLLQTDRLRDWLLLLAENSKGKMVIVPGGGVFADQVRFAQNKLGFDDRIAHRMAILGMDQFAWLCHGLVPHLALAASENELSAQLEKGHNVLLLVSGFLEQAQDLPENWSLTSDSIAAWLAQKYRAEQLVMIKSCPLCRENGSADSLMQAGIVDAMFPLMLKQFKGQTAFFSVDQIKEFQAFLRAHSAVDQVSCQA